MSSSASRRFRKVGPSSPQAQQGHHANSITIVARKGGHVVQHFEMPAGEPVPVFQYIQQAIGALAAATERKQVLVLGVVPKWKGWIIRYILRAV